MQDFPSNSRKAARAQAAPPSEPKRVEQVTSAPADRRRKGLGRQFKETFIGGSAKMAASYMVEEVIIPAFKDTMIDALQGGIEKLFLGDTRSRRSTPSSSHPNVGRFDYSGISTGKTKPAAQSQRSLARRTRHAFDDILLHSRQDATEVLDQMFEILSRYGSVSVSDLYALTGIRGDHTDVKWGWVELRGAKVVKMRNGKYVLDLPEPVSFD